jgi:hypothetical protein
MQQSIVMVILLCAVSLRAQTNTQKSRGGSTSGQTGILSISPFEATADVGASVQFHVLENGKDATATWSIEACNSDCGKISSTGLYMAPSKVPNPPKVRIKAKLTNKPDFSVAGTVIVIAPKQLN